MATHDTDLVSQHFNKLSNRRDSAVRELSSYTPSGGYTYSTSASYKPRTTPLSGEPYPRIASGSSGPGSYTSNCIPTFNRYVSNQLYSSSTEPVRERTIVIGNPSRSTSPVLTNESPSRSPSNNNGSAKPGALTFGVGDIPTKTVIEQEGYIIHKVPSHALSHISRLQPTDEKVVTKVTVTSTEGTPTNDDFGKNMKDAYRSLSELRSSSGNINSFNRPRLQYGANAPPIISRGQSLVVSGNSIDGKGDSKTITSNFSYSNGLVGGGISQISNYSNTRNYGNNLYNSQYTTYKKPLNLYTNSQSIPYSSRSYISPSFRFSSPKDTSLVSTPLTAPILGSRSCSYSTLKSQQPYYNYVTATPLMSAANTGLLDTIDRKRSHRLVPYVPNRIMNHKPTESDMLLQCRSERPYSINIAEVVAQEPPVHKEYPLSADPVQRTLAEFNGIMMPIPLKVQPEDVINLCDGENIKSWANDNCTTDPPTVVDCVVICRELNGGMFDPRQGNESNTDVRKISPPNMRIVDAYERFLIHGSDMVLYTATSAPLLRFVRVDFKEVSSGSHGVSLHPILVWFKKGSSYRVLGRVSLGDIIEITNGYEDCLAFSKYLLTGNRKYEDDHRRRIGGLDGNGIIGPRLGGNRPVVLSSNNVIRMLFMGGVELCWVALDPAAAEAWMMVLEYILIEMRPNH